MGEIRTGFVTQTHTGAVTYQESIAFAGEAGFDFVELYLDGATERHAVDSGAVRRLCEDAGLDLLVHLPFADLDLGTPRVRVREACLDEQRACIRDAAEMGAEKAVLHASSHATPPEWDREDVFPAALESIRRLDGFGTDHDMEICVENLPGVMPTIRDFDAIFAETDAAMTLDTGHARVDGFGADDTAAFIAEHHDRVSHVHANDAREARDEHVPTGSGTTDFRTAFEPLVDSGWDGTISVEVYTFDFDYLELSKRKLDECLRGK
jgi:sugar phosphate isomerase/epimerase